MSESDNSIPMSLDDAEELERSIKIVSIDKSVQISISAAYCKISDLLSTLLQDSEVKEITIPDPERKISLPNVTLTHIMNYFLHHRGIPAAKIENL